MKPDDLVNGHAMTGSHLIDIRAINTAIADGNPERSSLANMAFLQSLLDKKQQILERTFPAGEVLDEQRPLSRIQVNDSRKGFCLKMPEQALDLVIHQTVDPVRKLHAESHITTSQKPGRIIKNRHSGLLPVRIDHIFKNSHEQWTVAGAAIADPSSGKPRFAGDIQMLMVGARCQKNGPGQESAPAGGDLEWFSGNDVHDFFYRENLDIFEGVCHQYVHQGFSADLGVNPG